MGDTRVEFRRGCLKCRHGNRGRNSEVLNETAGSQVVGIINKHLTKIGYSPMQVEDNIIPDDDSTLFVCSGMQNLKPRFKEKSGERIGTVQSCIRTNDIDLWGDGMHLCFFRMLGCFSFGNSEDYQKTCKAWLDSMKELGLEPTSIHVHPDSNHRPIFEELEGSFEVVDNIDCLWSDGNIGGYCSEFFIGDVEIGNLVNPMGDSVDVGFGLERICKLLGEEYELTHDLVQFLEHCFKHDVKPGMNGRNYVVRKILRLWLRQPDSDPETMVFRDWGVSEKRRIENSMRQGYMMLRRHHDKPDSWWWSSIGLLPEEVKILKKHKHKKPSH